VRVVPNAYELMKNQFPDVRSLCNGFKLRYQKEMQMQMQSRGGR
jgi:transcription elongation factor SPT6